MVVDRYEGVYAVSGCVTSKLWIKCPGILLALERLDCSHCSNRQSIMVWWSMNTGSLASYWNATQLFHLAIYEPSRGKNKQFTVAIIIHGLPNYEDVFGFQDFPHRVIFSRHLTDSQSSSTANPSM